MQGQVPLYVTWNGVDERAFVPTPDMDAALDVLPGAPAGVAESRSPFSFGVYTVDHSAPEVAAVPMRMYFVSKAVADNRSQNEPLMERCVRNWRKGTCILSGSRRVVTRRPAAHVRKDGCGRLWRESISPPVFGICSDCAMLSGVASVLLCRQWVVHLRG